MEVYGRSEERNGSDRASGRGPVGVGNGLEESMRRPGLWNREFMYPERSGVTDCAYYLRTGFCGYGIKCRFNHPRDRSSVVGAVGIGGEEFPERPREPACQFYLRTGSCKFGAFCKFHHPRDGGGSISNLRFNIYGYPLRPGEKECSYYLKTGQCKFGITCKFHHPQLVGISTPSARPFYQTVQSSSIPSPHQYRGPLTSYRIGRPPILPGSCAPGAYGPLLLPPGVVPIPGWSTYSAPVSPVLSPSAQPTVGVGSLYGVSQLSSSAPGLVGPYPSFTSSGGPSISGQKEINFPKRPGQPDCQYYLKTGDCKFGTSCRFNHPLAWLIPKTNCVLSPLGLPLRPGELPCAFYLQNGSCKFGNTCKFDHPMGIVRYSPSVPSLTDVPVAPYRVVGSSLAPLAPSNRPEILSGSKLDSHSSRMPSSGNASSSSVGLIFSQAGSASLSTVQLPSQSSTTPLSITISKRQSGEIRRSI
ncbi:Zinc finger CCCH domain-containing protein [Actinidia chinensis var. chinensis]|uniref:Zinc finger CCCH domain-containing protein n=1 Tax=Actinidia chinensis var. chinensis TaxID=1590841 RepID=A0A2R6QEE5_ACTCC|nr:Zinc finger CCCH domain-containing protein [Actinidia chinensis var. chinensis]